MVNNLTKLERKSGVLLHPTSLPSPFGIGELGSEAYKFVDFLENSGQKLWQVLPLGPTGYGDSPYASFSTHAGNPLLISIEALILEGYVKDCDLVDIPTFNQERINYGVLIPWKMKLLEKATTNFFLENKEKEDFNNFCLQEDSWLDDYSLFMAVKEHFDAKAISQGVFGAMWSNFWDGDIALREKEAIIKWKKLLSKEILSKKVFQFFYFKQWIKLKEYANKKGIKIIGDIPIFVAADSADVWSNRELFLLDDNGSPTCVAGVPPDYFSETGQLWGNPIYNWKLMEKKGFKWWIDRVKSTLKMVDIIRIDHFRGFEAYWEIPAGNKTAVNGKWIKAPGMKLFKQIEKELGTLPILAEDLGVINEEVLFLRDSFNFPGMRILQFAFDSEEGDKGISSDNIFQPHNYDRNSVVYTGTHDNSTMKGWLSSCKKEDLDYIKDYFNCSNKDLTWLFIRSALSSVASYSIIPLQDFLELDDSARMNIPSTVGGNWTWRYKKNDLSQELINKIYKYTKMYARL